MSTEGMVHRHLECLKYLGSNDLIRQQPSGQGIPVDIVAMPDLLLDFRQYLLEASTGHVCTVGGRAARAACVLQHLATDDEGTFRVFLATRTAELGIQLLRQEFSQSQSQQAFGADLLQGVLRRSGEPRCALRETLAARARPSPPRSDNELKPEDLHKWPLDEAIRRARTLYFAALRYDSYQALLAELLKSIANATNPAVGQALFIDASHAEQDDGRVWSYLLRTLPALDRVARDRIAAVFVPHVALSANAVSKLDVKGIAASLTVPIIHYAQNAANSVQYVPVSGQPVVTVQCETDFSMEGVPERFKAGVLLASSTRRALKDVANLDPSLHDAMVSEWGDRDPGHRLCWERVLEYAVRLTACPSSCTVYDLLRGESNPPAHWPALRTEARRNGSATRRLQVNLASRVALDQFAVLRRSFSNNGGRLSPDSLARVVMFDLDGTLIDSSAQRERCLHTAFGELAQRCAGLPAFGPDGSSVIEFFTRHVYTDQSAA